jgi:hypothetical protein
MPGEHGGMRRTPTYPPDHRGMWRRLVGRAHPDAGGDHDLFIWTVAVRDTRKPEAARSRRPRVLSGDADLSRVSERTRELILFGDKEGRYTSRSEADFAACLGMFVAGFEEAEVWATMTDPTHGISEKFLEKGRGGERYLSLTIGKAAAKATASRLRVGRSKAPRVRRRVA